jgi:hypothetical protein
MQEPRAVRMSNPLWPRVMARTPQGVRVSVDRGTGRPAIELRNTTRLRRPTGIWPPGRQQSVGRNVRGSRFFSGVTDPGMSGHSVHGN